MKTNVYKGSYDDLSELTVNAKSLISAVTSLMEIRPDQEPRMVRKIVSGISVPYPTVVPRVQVNVSAIMTDGSELPPSVTVRPTSVSAPVGGYLALYAINTSELSDLNFVGWFIGDVLIGKTEQFLYKVPSTTDPKTTIEITAKYSPVPVVPKVTVETYAEYLDGSPVPPTITTEPITAEVELGESVTITTSDSALNPAQFIGWYNEDTLISTEASYEYVVSEFADPEETITLIAKYSNQ